MKDNPSYVIEAISGVAFSLMKDAPAYAVQLLDVLDGVGIPTASTILTVVDPDGLGIIDIRAWQALSRRCPDLFWWKGFSAFSSKHYGVYLEMIGELAGASALSCREVDMALWQLGGSE